MLCRRSPPPQPPTPPTHPHQSPPPHAHSTPTHPPNPYAWPCRLSFLVAFANKVEREFWQLLEGPWAAGGGRGMAHKNSWVAAVRAATSVEQVRGGVEAGCGGGMSAEHVACTCNSYAR